MPEAPSLVRDVAIYSWLVRQNLRAEGANASAVGEAILGGSGGMPPPLKIFKRCDFVHSGMILSSNFISFWRHFFGFLSFDLARKHSNGKKKTL